MTVEQALMQLLTHASDDMRQAYIEDDRTMVKFFEVAAETLANASTAPVRRLVRAPDCEWF